jgi:hypothetical protein
VVDFDEEDVETPLQFVRQACHYGIRAYLERSKRKGWHVWMFMELPGVAAAKARLVIKAILDDIGASATEIFPKQDALGEGARYGNFINAPLFGLAVRTGRTVFVDPDVAFKPYPDQWEVLAHLQRVKESLLDEIIEINELKPDVLQPGPSVRKDPPASSFHGLLPYARKMLVEGVRGYQRISCFRLAIQLKKVGLPLESTVAVLQDWARRNQPAEGKRLLREAEVKEQVEWAYRRNYRSCGCEEPAISAYCHPSCPLLRPRKDEGAVIPPRSSAKPDIKGASDERTARTR